MGFRDNLKAELFYKDMMVKELAEKSGVQKRTIDNYLREKYSIPSADAACSIARVLGVSVEYLVTGEAEKNINSVNALPPKTRALIRISEKLTEENYNTLLKFARFLQEDAVRAR